MNWIKIFVVCLVMILLSCAINPNKSLLMVGNDNDIVYLGIENPYIIFNIPEKSWRINHSRRDRYVFIGVDHNTDIISSIVHKYKNAPYFKRGDNDSLVLENYIKWESEALKSLGFDKQLFIKDTLILNGYRSKFWSVLSINEKMTHITSIKDSVIVSFVQQSPIEFNDFNKLMCMSKSLVITNKSVFDSLLAVKHNRRFLTAGETSADILTGDNSGLLTRVTFYKDCSEIKALFGTELQSEAIDKLCIGEIPMNTPKSILDSVFLGSFRESDSFSYYQKSHLVFTQVKFDDSGKSAKITKWLNRHYMP